MNLKDCKITVILSELRCTNYTVLPDYKGGNQPEWVEYRSALRAMPFKDDWPHTKFPPRPAEPPLTSQQICEEE